MYNGIGLSTPRGSGTSGHIQQNLSLVRKPRQSREDFLNELKSLRQNVLPPPRKANPEIIEHEKKRQILIQVMKLRRRLLQEKLDPVQIQKRIEKAQKVLTQKLQKGQLQVDSKDSHLQSDLKEKEYLKLRDAFKVRKDYKAGSAFDFQTQQKKRLQKMATKHARFVCKHPQCGKSYEIQKQLQRHIKYKHDGQKEPLSIKSKQERFIEERGADTPK